ncbi:MAG: RNase adapter RapZ [Gammaproteobacteria bacterium]
MNLIIVSGLSGSGKSIALQALEDIGYNCIDNLPIALLHALAVQITHAADPLDVEFAVGIDARNLAPDLEEFPEMLDTLKKMGLNIQVIYLGADEQTLIKRFSETRRRHPLSSDDVPLNEAIRQERMYLEPVSTSANLTLDTSHTNVHQLRDVIRKCVRRDNGADMSILLESFGFKHGIPNDANFIFDVRCVSNPHWVPELRRLSGRDQAVIDYLEKHEDVTSLYNDIQNFLAKWIPMFEAENRSYMNIAIGCTGGYHRSVYFCERLGNYLRAKGKDIIVRHRELS